MKGDRLLYHFPLSVTLSLLLLLFGALFMGGYVAMLWGAQRETILRDSTLALTGEITHHQGHMQRHLDEGDLQGIQNELATLGTDVRVRLALLSDTDGRVLAAPRRVSAGAGRSRKTQAPPVKARTTRQQVKPAPPRKRGRKDR